MKQFILIIRFFSIFRKIFTKVRQLHKDENGAMNGNGLIGDSSTDPLAINVLTVSSDEVILLEIKKSHWNSFTFFVIVQLKKQFSSIQIFDLSTIGSFLNNER